MRKKRKWMNRIAAAGMAIAMCQVMLSTVMLYAEEDSPAPETLIAVSMSGDRSSDATEGYYNTERTVSITITESEELFNPEGLCVFTEAGTVELSDTDFVCDDGVETDVEGIREYTFTCVFYEEGKYNWSFTYTNQLGIVYQSCDLSADSISGSDVFVFVYDATNPTGRISFDGTQTRIQKLLEILTFDMISGSSVRVAISGADELSPVTLQYYVQTQTVRDGTGSLNGTAMTEEMLDALDEAAWITVENPLDAQELSESWTYTDEQFVVYIRVTDYAGNSIYIGSDGAISDTCGPDIELTPETPDADNADSDIYGYYNGSGNGKVSVAVEISDTNDSGAGSGLKCVTYQVLCDGTETQSGTLFSYDVEADGALTFEKIAQNRSYSGTVEVDTAANNSSNVRLIVTATDQAGNTSKRTVKLEIDITAPTIEISYDNNSPDSVNTEYFKENRTAVIRITERNFDAKDVVIRITNTDGVIPTVSEWTKSAGSGDTAVWTATILYSADGDYTFAIQYTDQAGNQAQAASYAEGTVAGERFTIDKTSPIVAVLYDNTDAYNDNYYHAARTAVITITEHNFDPTGVSITASADQNAMTVIPSWRTIGDVHTATVTFDSDALYTFAIAYTDMAGNAAADYAQDTFCVDLTDPQITISGVENESANSTTVSPSVVITDTHYDANNITLTLEGLRYGANYSCTASDVTDGQRFTFADIKTDDIYVLTVSAVDKAGNVSTQSIRFSVNCGGSSYDISAVQSLNQSYLTIESVTDLLIVETNPNRLDNRAVTLYKNGEAIILTEGEDYTCETEQGEDGWYTYTYRIFKEKLADDGTYSIKISSLDEAENASENRLNADSEISFIVDNTKPTIIITNLESDRHYYSKSYEVIMVINDNMALSNIVVTLDEEEYRVWEGDQLQEIADANGEFRFVIEESDQARTLSVTATDQAGNFRTVEVEHFWVSADAAEALCTGRLLPVGIIVGLLVLTGVILLVYKRKFSRISS